MEGGRKKNRASKSAQVLRTVAVPDSLGSSSRTHTVGEQAPTRGPQASACTL